MAAYGVLLSCNVVVGMCVCVCSLIPGVHGPAERMPGFSLLRIREIFPEIWKLLFCILQRMEYA